MTIKLCKTVTDEEPLHLLTVLDLHGLDATLNCFCAVEGYEKEKMQLAVAFAKEVRHLMPNEGVRLLYQAEKNANNLDWVRMFRVKRFIDHHGRHAYIYFAMQAAASADAADAPGAAVAAVAAVGARSWFINDTNDLFYSHTVDCEARLKMKAKQTEILKRFLEELNGRIK